VFLTTFIEQRISIKFCVKLGKTPTETYEILQTVYGDKALSRSVYLNGLNDLKTGVRIFRMIQEAGVLHPLEMQTQSQMYVKW
jgi:hypothetical protein